MDEPGFGYVCGRLCEALLDGRMERLAAVVASKVTISAFNASGQVAFLTPKRRIFNAFALRSLTL